MRTLPAVAIAFPAHWPRESAMSAEDLAFEDLCRTHERRVLRVAWRLLGNLTDAEDAAQEVFLRLHKHWSRLDLAERAVAAWLYQVTLNVCRDHVRRARPVQELDEVHRSADPTPEAHAATAQARDRLIAAIAQLPERERAALILRELEGLSSAEAAAILGSSEVTIRTQIHSAKQKLRGLLR